jgi:hypothetical protein
MGIGVSVAFAPMVMPLSIGIDPQVAIGPIMRLKMIAGLCTDRSAKWLPGEEGCEVALCD